MGMSQPPIGVGGRGDVGVPPGTLSRRRDDPVNHWHLLLPRLGRRVVAGVCAEGRAHPPGGCSAPALGRSSRHTGSRRCVFAAVSCALALFGCIPVPSVVGRPAAVVPQGTKTVNIGGGGFYEELENQEGADAYCLGYYHTSSTVGLPHDCDLTLGCSNVLQGFATLRCQVLGRPEAGLTTGTTSLDSSVEVGAAITIPLEAYTLSGHVGINVSLSGQEWPKCALNTVWGYWAW